MLFILKCPEKLDLGSRINICGHFGSIESFLVQPRGFCPLFVTNKIQECQVVLVACTLIPASGSPTSADGRAFFSTQGPVKTFLGGSGN